jgi:hypothetical protein
VLNRLAQQQQQQDLINRIQQLQLAQQLGLQAQPFQQQLQQQNGYNELFSRLQQELANRAQQGSLSQNPLGQQPGFQASGQQGSLVDLLARTQQGVGGFQSWGQPSGVGYPGRSPYGIA